MKYNEDTIKRLEQSIKRGLSNKKACDLVGISYETFYAWQKEHTDFSDRIKRIRAEKVEYLLDNIRIAGIGELKVKCDECGATKTIKLPTKSWQAIAWILERTEFEDFGLKQDIKISEGIKIIKDDI